MMLEQIQIAEHIAAKGVINCPTACAVKTRGVYLSQLDKQRLLRHQQLQDRINYLKGLLFKDPLY